MSNAEQIPEKQINVKVLEFLLRAKDDWLNVHLRVPVEKING